METEFEFNPTPDNIIILFNDENDMIENYNWFNYDLFCKLYEAMPRNTAEIINREDKFGNVWGHCGFYVGADYFQKNEGLESCKEIVCRYIFGLDYQDKEAAWERVLELANQYNLNISINGIPIDTMEHTFNHYLKNFLDKYA